MVRWITENSRKDMIQYEEIHLKIGVASIDEKFRESYLRQFGHIQRRAINAPVRKSNQSGHLDAGAFFFFF